MTKSVRITFLGGAEENHDLDEDYVTTAWYEMIRHMPNHSEAGFLLLEHELGAVWTCATGAPDVPSSASKPQPVE